ncbi:ADP-ribosylation factor-like isoform X2 [Argopecten irradians]|uniref:ADP-ribosylation factor-like isoform X2 n=1 Tax=Argopecten irradians TaxID=31199 RepID=UPI003717A940
MESGKTAILYRLKLGDVVSTTLTVGFNVETVAIGKGITLTVWDVGGQRQVRALWRHYFAGTQGLVYVVDSTDKERLPEAAEELFRVLENPDMSRNCPVVVIANKNDKHNAVNTSEIVDTMNLHSLRNRKWNVHTSSAVTGEGIGQAFQELGKLIKERK